MELDITVSNINNIKDRLNSMRDASSSNAPYVASLIANDILAMTDIAYNARATEIATIEESSNPDKWTTLEDVPYKLEIEKNGSHARVIGTVGASWLEFGSGVKKNSNSNHPFLIAPYGSYGKQQGATGHSWVYAKGKRSYGYQATLGMYNAAEYVRSHIKKYLDRLTK